MELTRALHNEVVRSYEQPIEVHLQHEVDDLGHHAHFVEDADVELTESSPLILKAGTHRVAIDADVDLNILKSKFAADELAAFEEDTQLAARDIVKDEAIHLVSLSIPITCLLMLELVPQLVIAMMVGTVSGDESPQVIAAGTLSDFVSNQAITNVINGFGAAVSAMCAQSFGARQHKQLWLYAQAGVLACAYSLIPISIVCLSGERILTLMGQDPALAHLAGIFIFIGLVAVPFQMVFTVICSALQAQNIATPVIKVSVISYAITLPLAYVVGFPMQGGYLGISWCLTVSYVIKAFGILPVLFANKLYVDAWPGWQWSEANRLAKRLWPMCAGSVLMTTFQTLGFNLMGLLCGFLPNAAVTMASSSITSTYLNFSYVPLTGLCAGGIVRIGNALGAGHPRQAKIASGVVVGEMLVVSVATMLFCWKFARLYASGYTDNATALDTSTRLITHLLPLIPLTACVLAAQSIFQVCGKRWLCAKLNFFFLFAVGVPLGVFLAMPLGESVFGLWNGQLIGAIGFIVATCVWLHRLDWNHTAHEARLNAHVHVEEQTTPIRIKMATPA